jgi:hypothetical protein
MADYVNGLARQMRFASGTVGQRHGGSAQHVCPFCGVRAERVQMFGM